MSMTESVPSLTEVDVDAATDAYAGRITYPPGARLGPRLQTNVQWVAVERGHVTVLVDDNSVVVRAGHGILLWPGATERFDFHPQRHTTHVWCSWRWSDALATRAHLLWSTQGGSTAAGPRAVPVGEAVERLVALALAVPARAPGEPPTRALLRDRLVDALAWSLLAAPATVSSAALPASVRRCLDIVRERYAEPWTLARLAAEVGVTPAHLVRALKRCTAETPMALLWRLRAERGADLLRASDLPVFTVAERVGCSSPAHFSRLIRARFGRSPTQLRAEARAPSSMAAGGGCV